MLILTHPLAKQSHGAKRNNFADKVRLFTSFMRASPFACINGHTPVRILTDSVIMALPVKNSPLGSILTIFRSSAADRRSAFKSSSRFWFFLRHQKEQEEKDGKYTNTCLFNQIRLLSMYSLIKKPLFVIGLSLIFRKL